MEVRFQLIKWMNWFWYKRNFTWMPVLIEISLSSVIFCRQYFSTTWSTLSLRRGNEKRCSCCRTNKDLNASKTVDKTLARTIVWWSSNNSGPPRRCSSTARWASGWPTPCCRRCRGPCCGACGFCVATPARRRAGGPLRRGRSSGSSWGNGWLRPTALTTLLPAWSERGEISSFWFSQLLILYIIRFNNQLSFFTQLISQPSVQTTLFETNVYKQAWGCSNLGDPFVTFVTSQRGDTPHSASEGHFWPSG